MKNTILAMLLLLGVGFSMVDSAPAPLVRERRVTLKHSWVIVGSTIMADAMFENGKVRMISQSEFLCWQVTYVGIYSVRGVFLYVALRRDGEEHQEVNYIHYKGRITCDSQQVIELEMIPEQLEIPPIEEK